MSDEEYFGDIELVSETCHDKSFYQHLLEDRRKTLFTQFMYKGTISGVNDVDWGKDDF